MVRSLRSRPNGTVFGAQARRRASFVHSVRAGVGLSGETSCRGALLIVRQVSSPIRCSSRQRATLVGLGLNKMYRRSVLPDVPPVRGMIGKVAHLVEIVAECPADGSLDS